MSEARVIDRPTPGFFKARLARKAPWVAARITYRASQPDRSPMLQCLVAGDERDPYQMWPFLTPIDEAEYRRLLGNMPDDPRQVFDPAVDVPSFGQEGGHNSRDALLVAAAAQVIDRMVCPPSEADETAAEKVAQLVKAIITERDMLGEAAKEASEPLKRQLDAIRREHVCDAEAYRPKLLAWLGLWLKANGKDKVQASGAVAHWSTRSVLEIVDEKKVPREFLVPDEKKIMAALKAGRRVRGAQLVTITEARVL